MQSWPVSLPCHMYAYLTQMYFIRSLSEAKAVHNSRLPFYHVIRFELYDSLEEAQSKAKKAKALPPKGLPLSHIPKFFEPREGTPRAFSYAAI